MTSSHAPWWISAAWVSLTFLAFLAVDATSLRGWVLMTTIAIVPSFVLLKLWSDGPPTSVAEVLRGAEGGR